MFAPAGAPGIAATLSAVVDPLVQSGHVAGWIGVGAPGEGPGGADEWLQIGLNSGPAGTNTLYYELVLPGVPDQYVELARNIATGSTHRLAVLEMTHRPGWWRVWLDGRPASDPLELQGSHGTLTPMAQGENWDGGSPACNRYAYRFDGVSVASRPGGSWRPLGEASWRQDEGTQLLRSGAGFLAESGAPAIVSPPPSVVEAPADGCVAISAIRQYC